MTELEIIKYLIAEIEEEQRYNEEYGIALKQAVCKEKNDGGYYWKYMLEELNRAPRQSSIKANAMKIRQLLLKLY